jgi:hypothetical protein
MPVSNTHPQYELYKPVWTKTRDAVRGSVAVKEKRQLYLPVPDAESNDDRIGSETLRYRQYLKRALFTNFTGRTKNALVGAAFRKPPVIEIPDGIDYLIDDATGDGLGMEQLAKDELSNLLERLKQRHRQPRHQMRMLRREPHSPSHVTALAHLQMQFQLLLKLPKNRC